MLAGLGKRRITGAIVGCLTTVLRLRHAHKLTPPSFEVIKP